MEVFQASRLHEFAKKNCALSLSDNKKLFPSRWPRTRQYFRQRSLLRFLQSRNLGFTVHSFPAYDREQSIFRLRKIDCLTNPFPPSSKMRYAPLPSFYCTQFCRSVLFVRRTSVSKGGGARGQRGGGGRSSETNLHRGETRTENRQFTKRPLILYTLSSLQRSWKCVDVFRHKIVESPFRSQASHQSPPSSLLPPLERGGRRA